MYRFLERAVARYARWAHASARGRPPVQEVRRDLDLVVDELRPEAEDVVSLRLVDAGGRRLPGWHPGAHLDLELPSGRTRQYSLCGDPGDRRSYRIAVRRIADGGGGSVEVHDALRAGARVRVRGPRNAFPFITAQRYLFIAGGIGITPILPMVRLAAARGADWRLVFTGRSRATMPFLGEIAGFDQRRVWVRSDEEYGIPASGAELLEHASQDAVVYCCGPTPMITGVRLDLPASPADSLHFERFSPPPVVGGRPFRVGLARRGLTLQVPADRSALSVIREHVPDVPYSCRQGFCGTCEVRVLSGSVEHRDAALTEEERRDRMMICVSRAAGEHVELDL
ncbi:oxidoreductase [Saccharopolyspora rhizosphaerae]|uniref:Oxidoreductase n=1 Tax=Saccharopolyspora rhizosphaerae TaxID=2492662 RepID=A0A3R8P5E2_9PSEU|nr:PDR/VanB family oxidoreductase [Saccharopolyspora rhizosphaerae]RRO16746.1 oxidoreductase [Saccharopolyspora rhizosphaerae]